MTERLTESQKRINSAHLAYLIRIFDEYIRRSPSHFQIEAATLMSGESRRNFFQRVRNRRVICGTSNRNPVSMNQNGASFGKGPR